MSYSGLTTDLKGTRALIVDDVATNRFLLKAILKQSGYVTDECKDGNECLEYCNTQPLPDVILLDIMMPGISGIETCEILRRYYSKHQLPIIMVTTFAEAKDVARGLSAGANDYVTKPLDRAVLMARVENHLLISRAQKEIESQKVAIQRSFEIQRAMGDVLPQAIAVESAEGTIIYGNRQLEVMCGSMPILVADVFSQIGQGVFRSTFGGILDTIEEDSSAVIDTEIEASLSGRKLVVGLLSRPIVMQDGSKFRLWMWRNLSETRELEDAVSQRIKLETLGLFSMGVAHNFNNILSGILGASELLARMTEDNPKAERCISVIKRGVSSGMSLTKRLSSLVRREANGVGSTTNQVAEAVAAVVGVQEVQSGDRIRFEMEIPENLPPVQIAEQNLLDILTNLVANAVDAIRDGGDVIVSARHDESHGMVAISVKDSGSGMDAETQARVFEPFFSTKNMDTRNGVSYDGNGLGLWTVHSLTKACQGGVSVTSAPGEGSTFTVSLPVAG